MNIPPMLAKPPLLPGLVQVFAEIGQLRGGIEKTPLLTSINLRGITGSMTKHLLRETACDAPVAPAGFGGHA